MPTSELPDGKGHEGIPVDGGGEILEGKYRLQRRMGACGEVALFEAEHVETGARHLVRLTRSDAPPPADLPLRLADLVRVLARLRHDNVCDVVDAGVTGEGARYLVLPLLRGRTLADIVANQGHLSLDRAAHLARQILSALRAAHAVGVVHGALSPRNLFVTRVADEPNFVKVLGLGVLRALEAGLSSSGSVDERDWRATTAYLSPEQAQDDGVADAAADRWAVGVMLYEMLSGRRPFDGGSRVEVLARIRQGSFVPLAVLCPEIAEGFAAVVAKALEADPSRRFECADVFAQRLEAAWQEARRRDRPPAHASGAESPRAAPSMPPPPEEVVPPRQAPLPSKPSPVASPVTPHAERSPGADRRNETAAPSEPAMRRAPEGRPHLSLEDTQPAPEVIREALWRGVPAHPRACEASDTAPDASAGPAPTSLPVAPLTPRPRKGMETMIGVPPAPIPTVPSPTPVPSAAAVPVAPDDWPAAGTDVPLAAAPQPPGKRRSATVVGLPPPMIPQPGSEEPPTVRMVRPPGPAAPAVLSPSTAPPSPDLSSAPAPVVVHSELARSTADATTLWQPPTRDMLVLGTPLHADEPTFRLAPQPGPVAMGPAFGAEIDGGGNDGLEAFAAQMRRRRALLFGIAGGVLLVVVVALSIPFFCAGRSGPARPDAAGATPGPVHAPNADATDVGADRDAVDSPSTRDATLVADGSAAPGFAVRVPEEDSASPDGDAGEVGVTDSGPAMGDGSDGHERHFGDDARRSSRDAARVSANALHPGQPASGATEGTIDATLAGTRPGLDRCFGGSIDRYFSVAVTVRGLDGTIEGLAVTGDLVPATVQCIRQVIGSLTFAPFSQAQMTVHHGYAPGRGP